MLLHRSIELVSVVYTCITYFFNALVHVIYSGVSGQCSYTILYFRDNAICMVILFFTITSKAKQVIDGLLLVCIW